MMEQQPPPIESTYQGCRTISWYPTQHLRKPSPSDALLKAVATFRAHSQAQAQAQSRARLNSGDDAIHDDDRTLPSQLSAKELRIRFADFIRDCMAKGPEPQVHDHDYSTSTSTSTSINSSSNDSTPATGNGNDSTPATSNGNGSTDTNDGPSAKEKAEAENRAKLESAEGQKLRAAVLAAVLDPASEMLDLIMSAAMDTRPGNLERFFQEQIEIHMMAVDNALRIWREDLQEEELGEVVDREAAEKVLPWYGFECIFTRSPEARGTRIVQVASTSGREVETLRRSLCPMWPIEAMPVLRKKTKKTPKWDDDTDMHAWVESQEQAAWMEENAAWANILPLSPAVRDLWDRHVIGFRPIEHAPYRGRELYLQVVFFSRLQREVGFLAPTAAMVVDQPTCKILRNVPDGKSSSEYGPKDIQHGDVYLLKTEDPLAFPLPDARLLEICYAMQVSLAGLASPGAVEYIFQGEAPVLVPPEPESLPDSVPVPDSFPESVPVPVPDAGMNMEIDLNMQVEMDMDVNMTMEIDDRMATDQSMSIGLNMEIDQNMAGDLNMNMTVDMEIDHKTAVDLTSAIGRHMGMDLDVETAMAMAVDTVTKMDMNTVMDDDVDAVTDAVTARDTDMGMDMDMDPPNPLETKSLQVPKHWDLMIQTACQMGILDPDSSATRWKEVVDREISRSDGLRGPREMMGRRGVMNERR